MDRSFLVLVVGLVALVCASTAPVPAAQGVPPVPKEDCTWNGEECGTANDDCLSHEPPPVKCEPGSIGDPDGDGCGCWIPV